MMPRGLTDQMEPMPPQIQELRTAIEVRDRAIREWRLRAEKAEGNAAEWFERAERRLKERDEARAEVQQRQREIGDLFLQREDWKARAEKAEAEVARLRAMLQELVEAWNVNLNDPDGDWDCDGGLNQNEMWDRAAALAHKGGGGA
jgi:chromosome segregation ATPase